MTNILITGVNGYIGLKIATHLVEVGNEIIGIDINSSNVKGLINKPNFKLFRVDITDTVSFPAEVQQVDIVIHYAALDSICSGNKIYSYRIRLKWNLKNTFSEYSQDFLKAK